MPKRAKVQGVEPGISGGEALGASSESQQWIFPNLDPNTHEVKTLMAACLAIGVKECFRSHVYSFGGNLYQQVKGGTIGLRLTTVVAQLRMQRWLRRVKKHLQDAGLQVWLCCFYVDDVRLVVESLPLGWKWAKWHQHPWTGQQVISAPEEEGSFQFRGE